MTKTQILEAVAKLKANNVPTDKPNVDKVHPTCCKGWRTRGAHSPYCFTQREFYVMTLRPSVYESVRAS